MTLLTGLFNILALLYVGRAVQLAVQIARNWGAIRREPLTREKQRLGEQAAFFLGVPPAVFVHELAHAVMVLAFGGQVVEFGYRVFWGYVVPQGSFSPAQHWVIAIAGTLGSLAFGALLWLLLRRNKSRTLQYFGLRAFRFQIYFSLVYYPVFTLFLPIGDWRTIYNFALTPILSGITAVAHALALFLFWRADQRGAFEMVAHNTTAEQERFHNLSAAAGAGDPAARLQAIAMMRAGGATRRARQALDDLLQTYPAFAEGWLEMAIQAGEGAQQVNREAFDAAGQALAAGLRGADQVALARQIRGLYYLQRGDGAAAQGEVDEALGGLAANDPAGLLPVRRAELHHMRSQAHRRQGRYQSAYLDNLKALEIAREMGQESLIMKYEDEGELIEKHAGRRLSETLRESPAPLE